ncbi:MAG: phage tail sheath C-terminal domain-containing protein [Planctomycetota bacterium]|jgi:phage tail sheath protein FI
MPVSPTYPGVYIEEIPSGVRTIVGVATSVAAFIDFFARGPMDQAVQIFNMGDFQREFGGLHTNSEASYAIDQFFKNGGSEAWVVRTAETTTFATASVVLRGIDSTSAIINVLRATAGRLLKGSSVKDPGVWGNNLRIDIDYNTSTPTSAFNLTVSEETLQNGRRVIVQTETYRNLTMNPADTNFVEDVVNDGSKLIQVSKLTPTSDTTTRPAQTGTVGSDASATGSNAVANLTAGDTLTITYPGGSAQATVQFTQPLSTLAQVRRVLESAIRAAGASPPLTAPEPLLTGATVELIGTQFRVLAGRSGGGFNADTILTFTDNTGTPATDVGLAGATDNVQLYSVGSTASIGLQVGGTTGANGNPPTATELRGIRDPDKSGMYALEDVDLFNILCIPRAAEISDVNQMQAVYSEAIDYCEERRAFLIIDIRQTTNNLQDARDWLDDNALFRHRNAAAYFPRPRIPDPLNDYRLKSVGASGTIAGLYARTDVTRGVWKAPAGIEAALRNVPDLDYKLTDPENGQLNILGLNCLRNFDVYGNVCWGSRTLMGADQQASEWKYVPVRRIALFIEESLFRGTKWVVFEPNDEPLWAQIRLNVSAFMHRLFRQGAFQGTTPQKAYLVKCDSETTTQADINLGIVNIVVGFAPLKPAEFVIIKIQQLAGQIQT